MKSWSEGGGGETLASFNQKVMNEVVAALSKDDEEDEEAVEQKIDQNNNNNNNYRIYGINTNDKIGNKNAEGMESLRVVCISDTHHNNLDDMPEGDVLIHAGDITRYGKEEHVVAFNEWVGRQRQLRGYRHVLVVRGNHENSFPFEGKTSNKTNRPLSSLLTNVTYLEQRGVELEGGYRVFGTRFCNPTMDLELEHPFFSEIPDGLDILITHGPPKGFLDGGTKNSSFGCPSLLEFIRLKRPRLVVFGHIHYGYGMVQGTGDFEGITFVNASICREHGNPANAPIVITLTKPTS